MREMWLSFNERCDASQHSGGNAYDLHDASGIPLFTENAHALERLRRC